MQHEADATCRAQMHFEARLRRNAALKSLHSQINTWADNTRAALIEHEEREKMQSNPNWGRF